MVEENFEGNYETDYPKPLPKEIPKDPKEWKKYANKNPIIKEHGLKVINNDWYSLLKILVFGLLIALGVLAWLIYSGYFQDEFICDLKCEPCPPCPEANCQPTLNCGDIYIPNEINVSINNQTG